MADVLELKMLKNKTLTLILLESEFPIEWYFEETSNNKENLILNLNLVSKEYLSLLEQYIHQYQPDFGVEEKGLYKNLNSDPIRQLHESKEIPYVMIDISENAADYLRASLGDYSSYITLIENHIEEIISKNNGNPPENSNIFEQLLVWREYLSREYKKEEDEVRRNVREAWMMMKIINITKNFEKENLKAIFICDSSHFQGIIELSKKLNIEVESIKLERKVNLNNGILRMNKEGDVQFLNDNIMNSKQSLIELSGIKIKEKKKPNKICYFFDTDEVASPFDINMAYDAGFDIVVPINNTTAEKVPRIVQDAIFSRKPNASTAFFIGGENVKEAEKISQKVLDSFVPPFECPVIIDPRGSHTTATAIVTKAIQVAKEHGIDQLSGKKVVILGGSGPVGQISALLMANLNCKTIISSRREKYIKELAIELNKKSRENASEIIGAVGISDEEKYQILKDADIIISVAKAGIEMISKEVLEKLPPNKILVDINLVPPYGINGLKPKYNNDEIIPGLFGIGALVIGNLKAKIEKTLLKELANTRGIKIFDYKYAFETAKLMLNI